MKMSYVLRTMLHYHSISDFHWASAVLLMNTYQSRSDAIRINVNFQWLYTYDFHGIIMGIYQNYLVISALHCSPDVGSKAARGLPESSTRPVCKMAEEGSRTLAACCSAPRCALSGRGDLRASVIGPRPYPHLMALIWLDKWSN